MPERVELTSDDAPASTSPLGRYRFAPILAVHFLGTLGLSLVLPFLVFIVADLGGASWTYGLLGATYSIFQLFGAPALGRWSDRVGRRPVLVASQLGTLTAWLLFFVALSLPVSSLGELRGASITVPLVLVFLARALDGATGGNVSVANSYVADLTRETPALRQRAFGRMGMAANVGFVIGPAAAGLLGGTSWGARLPVAIAAAFAALTSAAIILWIREPARRCDEGPPPSSSMIESGLHQQTKGRAHDEGDASAALGRRDVRQLLVATFIIFLGFNFFYAAFPVHADEAFEWSTGQLGIYFAVLSGMMIVAQGPVLSFVSRRVGPRATFAGGMLMLALALASLTLPPGAVTYLGAALFALGNGLAWPTFQARVAEVGGARQGAVQGAATSASSLASILGLVAGGALYPALGSTLFIAGASMFIVVLALTPLWFSRDETRADG